MFLNSKSSFVCFDEMQSLGKYKKALLRRVRHLTVLCKKLLLFYCNHLSFCLYTLKIIRNHKTIDKSKEAETSQNIVFSLCSH